MCILITKLATEQQQTEVTEETQPQATEETPPEEGKMRKPELNVYQIQSIVFKESGCIKYMAHIVELWLSIKL